MRPGRVCRDVFLLLEKGAEGKELGSWKQFPEWLKNEREARSFSVEFDGEVGIDFIALCP